MFRVRVGVVGCGMIAQLVHLPYLRALVDRFDIVALCDRSFDLAQSVAEHFRVPNVYAAVEDMLAKTPGLDAVVVLTPDHRDPVLAALERGKHVFTEKPLGHTIAEIEEVIAAAHRTGSKVMVGYMKRYDSGVRRGLEEIARIVRPTMARIHIVVGPEYGNWIIPELTRIKRADGSSPTGRQDERRRRVDLEFGSTSSGALEAYMDMFGVWSHDVNVYRAAYPAMPDSIKAHCSPDGKTLTASLRYADGFQCVFQGSSTSIHRFEESLTVWGSDRTVTLDISNPFLPNAPSTVRIWRDEPAADTGAGRGAALEEVITGSYEEAFRAQLAHFHDCVTSPGLHPLTSAHEALMDTRLMIDIVRAADERP
ncbi:MULTISPECIES: Gfo/Idh/MocA family protein [Streptomyces]|uniref:Gfo/Idh/MocA family protein n=1 Tax=Streptomyces TaxID=1883 RepID=UPI00163CAD64|nr:MULTISPECIES: Gfo/Idh/MocA family oxidoreductase [Streptomyces]MBC2874262.1 Gfo/Idh/MocA family oxidoreductase [Streptomyces sp. TYQ1024]UBI40297.1 Gfo/Idh/MocA family oxidoreductase [Streptomyces mobaraensis]UKW32877.1 Gfo/Idh/MocA family oxidoreductase [Streptomyces sp. TYQ1024]